MGRIVPIALLLAAAVGTSVILSGQIGVGDPALAPLPPHRAGAHLIAVAGWPSSPLALLGVVRR